MKETAHGRHLTVSREKIVAGSSSFSNYSIREAIMQTISQGDRVIATNEYWGHYTGTVVGSFMTYHGQRRVMVMIDSMIQEPKQHAILYQQNKYPREPYQPGEIVNFFESEIQILEDWFNA